MREGGGRRHLVGFAELGRRGTAQLHRGMSWQPVPSLRHCCAGHVMKRCDGCTVFGLLEFAVNDNTALLTATACHLPASMLPDNHAFLTGRRLQVRGPAAGSHR